jgi:tetratricopeptide (TPR) repeat protein
MLRLLELLELLELGPASRAIPIPKATRRKGQYPTSRPDAAPATPPATEARPRRGPPNGAAPTSTPPTGRPSKALAERIAEVETFFSSMDDLDHFGVLGVAREDPPSLLRRRFTELAKKFHPDAFSGQDVPAEVADKVGAISARLNEAYHVLASAEARTEYESMLGDARVRGDARRRDLVRDAAVKVKMANVHLNKREFDAARALLRNAVESDPHTKAYQAHLAWSMFADPKYDREDAVKEGLPMLLEAVKVDQENPSIHYYLGCVYKERGELKTALSHFQTAARLDKSFTKAATEARLLKSRLEKAQPTSSRTDVKTALSKLFKR